MIDAAERLVAEGGLGAMSLRAVQDAAGQRNKSAAQYHFGSRDGLVTAIVTARSETVDERRAAILAELGDAPALGDLVRAFVEPLAEATATADSHWARFLQVAIADPATSDTVTTALAAATYQDVRGRLVAALDDLPDSVRSRRLDQMMALVVWTLAVAESRARPVDVDDLVRVATGILTVPFPAGDLAELR